MQTNFYTYTISIHWSWLPRRRLLFVACQKEKKNERMLTGLKINGIVMSPKGLSHQIDRRESSDINVLLNIVANIYEGRGDGRTVNVLGEKYFKIH